MVKAKTLYQCDICFKSHDSQYEAEECEKWCIQYLKHFGEDAKSNQLSINDVIYMAEMFQLPMQYLCQMLIYMGFDRAVDKLTKQQHSL